MRENVKYERSVIEVDVEGLTLIIIWMCENSTSRCKTDANISDMFVGVINKNVDFLASYGRMGEDWIIFCNIMRRVCFV